jgi:elongator complex protein 3
MREIPPEFLIAGTTHIDLRRDIEAEIRRRKLRIQEIRFREIGFAFRDLKPQEKLNQQLRLKITKYKASKGDEYFLEYVNKSNILFGLCRLRIRKDAESIRGAIRELHVYGQSLPIGTKGNNIMSQHRGLGKLLVRKAEEIAKKSEVGELNVIAGVGVRQYFYNLGYKPNGFYVSKSLK